MTSRIVLCAIAAACAAMGQQRPASRASESPLPMKRVVLYKSGVGYFEHQGSVRDNQEVSLSFTRGQLNDVLKSLTVLDLGGGGVASVTYGSSSSIERRVGDLQLGVGERTTLAEVLATLRGARLEVRSGTTTVSGRLLSIERKTRSGGGATLEVDYLSLVTDSGEVKTTELSPSYSVRILDRELAGKMGRYLDVLAARHDAGLQRMSIATAGRGERPLVISYVSEAPVWKSTYRLVLPSKPGEQPLLQGWAIVDNTIGEDWSNVQLSLVAGAPQSFIQRISQPYFTRRPEIPLPQSALLAPQTHEATLLPGGARLAGLVTDPTGAVIAGASVRVLDSGGNVVAETTSDAGGAYSFPSLPEGQARVEVDMPGFSRAVINGVTLSAANTATANTRLQVGSVAQTVEVTAQAGMVNTSMAAARRGSVGSGSQLGGRANYFSPPPPAKRAAPLSMNEARSRLEAASSAQSLGDLFEYKLKVPITIRKNQSAMAPIVNARVAAEKVTLWNEASGGRPYRAVWLTNSSGLTLDGGSFSVTEDEAFAGEGVFDPIRPDEKRLLSYAVDLALTPSAAESARPQRTVRVRVASGAMIHEVAETVVRTYTIRNQDASPRTVIVEHPVRSGFKLVSEPRPAETTSAWMRFRLPVPAKSTETLTVEETRPLQTSIAISGVTRERLAVFVNNRQIPKPLEEELNGILAAKDAASELEDRREAIEEEAQRIFDDQQRLRENLKALKGTPEEKALVQRYTRQLDQQETRLEETRREIKGLKAQEEEAQKKIAAMIEALRFEGSL
jgi:hypothetical protein